VSLGETDAELLEVAPGVASLHIERTSYLASGRVVEFTRSFYRGDAYDFVAELHSE
jgi:GntR family transcriptional regulator